jgi:RimJ/RimL family protein N-acetyltransferase
MTMALNARVVRQMEKVGFTLEGRQREGTWVDGKPVDGLAYGILREEWPGREAVIERIGLKAR